MWALALSWATKVIPWWGRALAILAVAVALFGYGWVKGSEHCLNAAAVTREAQEKAVLEQVQKSAKVNDTVTAKYVGQLEGWNAAAANAQQQVKQYVTSKANAGCVVTRGFVQLYNHALGPDVLMPTPADRVDDAATGVELATVLANDIENQKRFESMKSQCESLQDWARQISSVSAH